MVICLCGSVPVGLKDGHLDLHRCDIFVCNDVVQRKPALDVSSSRTVFMRIEEGQNDLGRAWASLFDRMVQREP